MNENRPAACFTIHCLQHLRAALTAGAECGLPVIALSAAGASAFAGAGWFAALVTQGRAEFPDVPLIAILDCGNRAGDAIAALNRGLPHLIFAGHPAAAERLADIAVHCGADILTVRPVSCDLINASDPYYTARTYCASLENKL